jgi:transcriptional regulator with XRE-family HTH domain
MPILIGRSRVPEHLSRIGMSQAEFARRLVISPQMVTKIIQGEKQFSYLRAKMAADILGVSMEELVEWEYSSNKGKWF